MFQNEQEAAAQHQALQQQQIQQQQAAAQAAKQTTQHQITQQATQMAQQMLIQQQQQQQQQPMAMPIVALPDWNGKDAEGHLNSLDATLQANGQLGILNEPLRYSALLFTSCKNERKATEFIHFHMRQHPESSTKAIKDAFLERFQSEVRNNAAKARDAFFSRHIRMSMGMSVQVCLDSNCTHSRNA